MDTDRLAQVERIYHAVLEVSEDEWPSFLTSKCGDDVELRQEVESLLPFAGQTLSLIDVPPIDFAADLIRENERPDIIGKKIKHYRIVSQIGAGGMGDVFLATDTVLKRNVAIKFLSVQFAQNAAGLERFLREARSASALNHPNIITVYEVGKTKGTPFIATEFIDGKNLRRVMDEGEISAKDALNIASQIASALIAAHSAGIFHRDIKPENIMLREDKLVKVVDFGLAKISGTPRIETKESVDQVDPQMSAPGLVMGTLAYMSPEQAAGKPVDSRSDIWSLGVVMFEMFSGQKPFKGTAPGDVIASILNDQPELPANEVPSEINAVISKMLAKDPERRYQSGEELLVDINELRRDLGIGTDYDTHARTASNGTGTITGTSISSAEYVVEGVRKHRASWAVAAVVLVALLSVAGYLYLAPASAIASSIAVMPFENVSGDPNAEYLSDGMSEGLINGLSQLPEVKVVARSSTFKFKGQTLDLNKVANELGVQTILTGKVSKRDDALQISVELVNVNDNTQIWGETFVRKPTEIAQIQAEILDQIIGRLGLSIAKRKQQQIVEGNNADPQAYELLLKGRFFHAKGTEADAKKAIEYYDQAIALDPNYALAYAAASSSYLYLGVNGFSDPKEPLAKAETSARRAQELNPNLAEVHLATAGIKQFSWDWPEAQREYKTAIDLNPNLASAHFRYSLFLSTQGRHEEALAEMRKTRELDPLKRGINLDIGYVLYFSRDYDAAIEQYGIGLELDPEYAGGYYGRGLINMAKGDLANAIIDYKEFIRLNGDHTGINCYLGSALAKAGRTDEAKAILRRLETGKEYVSPVELAILYVGLNEEEKALASLERALAERDSQMQYLLIEPNFDQLRTEQRFAELVRKVGLGS